MGFDASIHHAHIYEHITWNFKNQKQEEKHIRVDGIYKGHNKKIFQKHETVKRK